MFRILIKIPYFFLLAWGVILLFFTAFLFPFGTESDAQFFNLIANQGSWSFKDSINVHNIFSNFLYFILGFYEISPLYGYRFLNLIYFSLFPVLIPSLGFAREVNDVDLSNTSLTVLVMPLLSF